MDLRALALIVLVGVAAACTTSRLAPREADAFNRSEGALDGPNIIIFVTDDQRADHTLVVMPSTRRLFQRKGVTFANAYATTPLCCPSRASIFTGRYAHNHGVLENEDGDELDQRSTIQHRLTDVGYRTAIAGKLLQGRPLSDDPEVFDKWALTGWGYYGRQFNLQGKMRTVRRYSTSYLAQRSVRWLRGFERDDDRPWFLYIAPTAPHLPYEAERKYADTTVPAWKENPASREADRRDKAPYVRSVDYSEEQGHVFQRQLRTLISVDDLVGGVFKELRKLDEKNDTLAFFLSDNGHMNGEHGLFGKRMPYLQSVRIPLMMRWPGVVNEGSIDRRLVGNIDIAPTVLNAIGISPDERYPMDGSSLLGSHIRDSLLLEQYLNGYLPDWVSLLTDDSQYIQYLDDQGRRTFAEYYDLNADPWQLTNLLHRDDSSARSAAMEARKRLYEVSDCLGPSCP